LVQKLRPEHPSWQGSVTENKTKKQFSLQHCLRNGSGGLKVTYRGQSGLPLHTTAPSTKGPLVKKKDQCYNTRFKVKTKVYKNLHCQLESNTARLALYFALNNQKMELLNQSVSR